MLFRSPIHHKHDVEVSQKYLIKKIGMDVRFPVPVAAISAHTGRALVVIANTCAFRATMPFYIHTDSTIILSAYDHWVLKEISQGFLFTTEIVTMYNQEPISTAKQVSRFN